MGAISTAQPFCVVLRFLRVLRPRLFARSHQPSCNSTSQQSSTLENRRQRYSIRITEPVARASQPPKQVTTIRRVARTTVDEPARAREVQILPVVRHDRTQLTRGGVDSRTKVS